MALPDPSAVNPANSRFGAGTCAPSAARGVVLNARAAEVCGAVARRSEERSMLMCDEAKMAKVLEVICYKGLEATSEEHTSTRTAEGSGVAHSREQPPELSEAGQHVHVVRLHYEV